MDRDDKRPEKLPRGHAYIHMRNRGYSIDIDYQEVDSAQAGRIIDAVMAIATGDAIEEKERQRKP